MSRQEVFLDTTAMIALAVPADSLYKAATAVMAALSGDRCPLVTSDFVLLEFLNASSVPSRRSTAGTLTRNLLSTRTIEVVECSRQSLIEALELYESRPDKEWSIVDCSSMVICKQRGIRRVFTHDRHFRQAGMQVLL